MSAVAASKPAPTVGGAGGQPPEQAKTGWPAYLLYLSIPLLPLQNIIDRINTPLRAVPGLNFLNLLILALVGAWFVRTLGRGRPLAANARHNKVLALFVFLSYLGLWRAVTYVGAELPIGPSDPGFVFWKDASACFLLFFAASNLFDDEQSMRRMTLLMLIVLPYMIYVHRDHLAWANSWHYDDDMRVRGTMMHLGSNELAAFYCSGLAICLGLLVSMPDLQWRIATALGAAGFGWGVIYSYSRSAYLAALLGLAIVGLFKSLRVTAAVLVVFIVGALFLPASVRDRFDMIGSEQTMTDESTRKRMELWDIAWDRFKENPILGTGLASFPKLNRYRMDTHNMYLRVLCELGVMGFVLFVAQFLVGLRQGWVLMRSRATPFARGLGLGLFAASAMALLLNLFGDRFSYIAVTGFYWIWHGMAARILRTVEGGGTWRR